MGMVQLLPGTSHPLMIWLSRLRHGALLVVGLAFLLTPAAAENVPFAAKVNEVVIPLSAFQHAEDILKKTLAQGGEIDLQTSEGRETFKLAVHSMIDQLIESELLFQSAKKMGLQVPEDEIKNKIAKQKTEFPSPQEFHKSLAAQGLTLDILHKNIESQILVEKVAAALAKNLSPTDQEIEDFYKENNDLFVQPERVHAYEIGVEFKEDIRRAQKMLNSGASIEAVVAQHSVLPSKEESGNLGMVERADVPDNEEKFLFDTKAGQFSAPFPRGNLTIVYFIREKFPKQVTSLSDARPRILEFIQNQKSRNAFQSWLAEERKKAKIEYGPSVKEFID